MKRSPPPLRSAPLSTNSAASHSASSRSTRRCMRSVSASRGLWTPGRSTSTSCQALALELAVHDPADRAPGRLRLVRGDRHLRADDRVHERRLADVRAPGDRDEARSGSCAAAPSSTRSWSASISPSSVSWSCPARCRTPWTRPPRGRGVLGADHDVAELARARRSARPRRPGTPARRSGSSSPRCSRFSSRIRSGVHELDAQVAVRDAAARSAARAAAPQLGRALDLEHRLRTRAGRTCARGAQVRRGWLCRVLGVGVHDLLHELVPHDVLAGEVDEVDVGHVAQDVAHDHETGALVARQVDLRDVAR